MTRTKRGAATSMRGAVRSRLSSIIEGKKLEGLQLALRAVERHDGKGTDPSTWALSAPRILPLS